MINIFSNNGKVHYGIQQLILDTPDDLINLSTDLGTGSTVFIISTSEQYMLNSQKQWIQITTSNNAGGGGGGEIDPSKTYVYDGGAIV